MNIRNATVGYIIRLSLHLVYINIIHFCHAVGSFFSIREFLETCKFNFFSLNVDLQVIKKCFTRIFC